MQEDAEVKPRVVEMSIDVKSWVQSLPGVREMRPPRCPACGAAAVDASGRVVLHGHGKRIRQCWGPSDPDVASTRTSLPQRRYACQNCNAVVVVRPRGLLPRRRYTAAAIALALWLWAVNKQTDPQVRAEIAVETTRGLSRPERWTTLRRWATAARDARLWRCVRGDADWTLRQCAERAARIIAAFADVTVDDEHARIFAAAAHVR